MHIKIKKLNHLDLMNLQKISIQTFTETFADSNTKEDMQNYIDQNLSLEQLKSEMENPDSEFYFAEESEKVLGYLKLNFGAAQTEGVDKDAVEIERVYVLKEFLRMKIGQILFEKSIEIAEERNADYIWLGVWERNERAIKFYEKNGFKIFGKHDFVLGKDIQTDLMMKLPIK